MQCSLESNFTQSYCREKGNVSEKYLTSTVRTHARQSMLGQTMNVPIATPFILLVGQNNVHHYCT